MAVVGWLDRWMDVVLMMLLVYLNMEISYFTICFPFIDCLRIYGMSACEKADCLHV